MPKVETEEKTTKKTAKVKEPILMNIYQKILAIQKELGVIQKNLKVNDKYSAVAERDVVDAVKPLEEKYGVMSYPASREESVISVLDDKVTIRVKTVYRFVDVDDPSVYLETISYGDGVDTLDKAPGKAMTYADKYALMKMYKISTGVDPDAEASPDDTANMKASEKQVSLLKSLIEDDLLPKVLKRYQIKKLEDLSKQEASDLISKIKGGTK